MMVAGRVNSLEVLHSDVRDAASGSRRVRRSARQPRQVQYLGTTSKKLRLKDDGGLALYLKAPQNASSLSVGSHSAGDPDVCFKVHIYTAPSVDGGGQVVILQTQGGKHVTVSQDTLTLMTPPASEPYQQIGTLDERFFHKYSEPGDETVRLKHLQSGKFLSATASGVSLLATDGAPRSIEFHEFQCNHT